MEHAIGSAAPRELGLRLLRPRWAWAWALFLAALVSLVGGCHCAAFSRDPVEREDEEEDVQRVAAAPEAVEDLQVAFKTAIARAGPAVVSVYSTKSVRVASPFDLLVPGTPEGRDLEQLGVGSGVIIDADGHVLTNNHVVEDAQEVKVRLADGRELQARVVGVDPATDLALLRVQGDDLTPATFGDSSALEVGDWVLAIGNPFGLPRTVSAGIVSAIGRADMGIVDYENFIQTDAAVNPGSSGGPLVDLQGRVVGINTAIASSSGGNNGIAFAIPIDMAKDVVEQLRDDGKVIRGHLGIMVSELSPELAESFGYEGDAGILVQDVSGDEAAAEAGIVPGDIITGIEGRPVTTVGEFRNAIAKKRPGTRVSLEVWRDGERKRVEAELGDAPGPTPEVAAEPAVGPRFGLALLDVTPAVRQHLSLEKDDRVVIADVEPGSPAARAGLRPGDVVESIDGTSVQSAAAATRALREADAAEGARLRIRREGVGQFVLLRAK